MQKPCTSKVRRNSKKNCSTNFHSMTAHRNTVPHICSIPPCQTVSTPPEISLQLQPMRPTALTQPLHLAHGFSADSSSGHPVVRQSHHITHRIERRFGLPSSYMIYPPTLLVTPCAVRTCPNNESLAPLFNLDGHVEGGLQDHVGTAK